MKTIISSPPENGIHLWFPSIARKCRYTGMSASETINCLASLSYRRKVPLREIVEAVNLVFETDLESTRGQTQKDRRRTWLSEATCKIFSMWQTTEQDLVDMSDVHPDDIDQQSLIKCLFPDEDAFICIGREFNRFATAPLNEHRDIHRSQFIVPAYMLARTGLTQAGNLSCRALENTGERRYIVLDFDDPPPQHHASIIRWLMGTRAPVLVIKSGGKSLHAWYATEAPESDAQFWNAAIMAGADPAIQRNRGQAVRLPMGTRDNGNVQRVIYFNPNNLPA